ncbi:2-oxoacid:acceptor oxidoreductase subunit alpha [candidate division BRC1 bacterium HGW-BRC1-1]|nr:MAG: 2-oxoacid:acceptor oxidoreductase subunit alpha [candidate division BRC1 bacterium HGW-BRC1-1]
MYFNASGDTPAFQAFIEGLQSHHPPSKPACRNDSVKVPIIAPAGNGRETGPTGRNRALIMNHVRPTTIRFEGDSGDGIISMGKLVARTAARLGYHVYTYSTFLAIVRGGQVTFQLRIGAEPLLSQGNEPDIVVALNRQAVHESLPVLRSGAIVIHPNFHGADETLPSGVTGLAVDFKELAEGKTGSSRSKNIVAAGAVMALLGLEEETADTVLSAMFGGKGEDIQANNSAALAAGYDEGEKHAAKAAHIRPEAPADPKPRMLISGNEAIALGALAGGVRFYAGYPITPASEIMEWLASRLPRVGGMMFQAEDEIAALGMCIGASYGGVKTMTATSGPGLSLMIELIGLAGMAEIPVVIVDVQRAGPSTGMPTKEAQGDLIQAVHGTHGEVPRVVLAPQTVADCFTQTIRAVNLSHRFHIPVILLSSQSLSHRMQTIDAAELESVGVYHEPLFDPASVPTPEAPFLRYREEPDGATSLRSVPGQPGGMYRAGGLEHDEAGNPNFEPAGRRKMVERRRLRMRAISRALRGETIYHKPEEVTTLGLMSWGATASVAREALLKLGQQGTIVADLLPHLLWPMPSIAIRDFLASGIKTLFIAELNATRQFAEMLSARFTSDLLHYGIEVVSITKDEGLPFTPDEIQSAIQNHLNRHQPAPEEVLAK